LALIENYLAASEGGVEGELGAVLGGCLGGKEYDYDCADGW